MQISVCASTSSYTGHLTPHLVRLSLVGKKIDLGHMPDSKNILEEVIEVLKT